MLVDANLLIYAIDDTSPFHERASGWFVDQLNGDRRVGLPWQSLASFLRLTTHPRVMAAPLSTDEAWSYVETWLDQAVTWVPTPGDRHASVLRRVLASSRATANLVPDAMLAALAIEHGISVASADSDFARFPEVRWSNPLA